MPTLRCPVAHQARYRSDAPAVVTPVRTWTYGDLDRAVQAVQHRLREDPALQGSRIGMVPRRTPMYLAWIWACAREGRCVVPVAHRWTPRERGTAFGLAGVASYVAYEADGLHENADCTRSEPVVELEPMSASHRYSASTIPLRGDATMIFTSGSTGHPKGVVHDWRAHVYSARGAAQVVPLRSADCWALSLPLYHVGGWAIVVRAALAGAAVAVVDDLAAAWTTQRISHWSMVATQCQRLLDATSGAPPPWVQAVLLGGGPLPEAMLDSAHARGWPVHASYGSTEMASQIATTPPDADRETLATAGHVLPYRELKIEATGEIGVRGATRCTAYLTDAGRVDPGTEGGWLRTGDIGHFDAEGRLHVTGRVDYQFISGGENIQPETVERALEALPQVARAVVVPVPDDEFGERPVAFVKPASGTAFSPQCYRSGLAGRLARFKHPDRYWLWPDDAPGGMKIDRGALRERARG